MDLRIVRPGRPRGMLDLVGLTLSGLCLVHCIALPVVLAVLPAVALVSHDEHHHWLHIALALVLVPVAFASLLPGFLRHRRSAVLYAGALGTVAIATGAFLEASLGARLSSAMTIAGSSSLVAAHWLNLSADRSVAHVH